jgi:xanthine dehydrogenase large subunit
MVSRAGFSADLSGPVMTRAICHFDNAYWLPDVAIHGYSGRHQHAEQHRVPRLRRAAGRDRGREHRRLGRARARQGRARRRRVNFYGPSPRPGAPGERNVTPYGQVVDDNIVAELVAELEATSGYRARAMRSPRSTRRARCSSAAWR